MPKARKKRSTKVSLLVSADDIEKNIERQTIIENWGAGVKTEMRLFEDGYELIRKKILQNEQEILQGLPKEILSMKISDFVKHSLLSVRSIAETAATKKIEAKKEYIVGKVDCLLTEMNQLDENKENANEARAKSSKRKVAARVRKMKKGAKGSALKTPLQKNAPLLQATPFFTPMPKTRLDDPKSLLPRQATEEEKDNFEAKIQIISATGSPITVSFSDERVRSRIQAALRANHKLVKAELSNYKE